MKAKPLKIVPCAISVKQEAELINLELGMSDVKRAEINEIKPLLTSVQLHELHLQTVIYNHIAAGVAVPCHLVLHVWKSLALSCGYAVLNKLFPSFIGFSSQGYESRNIIVSEPGRCRRTDGKKWRCSRSVLPNQKYCERHMHRGCQRSRKLVEASKDAPPAESSPPSKPNTNSETSNAGLSVSSPVSRQLMATPSTNVHENNNSSTTDITSGDESKRYANVNQNTLTTVSTTSEIVAESRTPVTTSINNVCAPKNNKDSDGKHGAHNRLGDRRVVTSSNIRHNVKIVGNPSFGFGFSPKSVHQVVGRDGSRFDQHGITESKPERCRRTDGKKWRCSSEVLPFQKYCGKHIHRGAKKLRVLSQLDPPSDHPGPPSSRSPTPMIVPKKEDSPPSSIGSPSTVAIPGRLDSSRLSTDLSISTPANAQVMMYDGHTQDTSSSSDTTISDNIPAYRAARVVSSRT